MGMSNSDMQGFLFFLFLLLLLGLIPAFIARRRGRSFKKWWIFGALLFPIAFPFSLFLKNKNKQQCNFCKEYIHPDAVVCPHCRNDPRKDPRSGIVPASQPPSLPEQPRFARWPTTED
jgi:hypothetical protein